MGRDAGYSRRTSVQSRLSEQALGLQQNKILRARSVQTFIVIDLDQEIIIPPGDLDTTILLVFTRDI